MGKIRNWKGVWSDDPEPDWEPLRKVFEDWIVVEFAWVGAIVLSNKKRLHAYEHTVTRRHLLLGEDDGASYHPKPDGRYTIGPIWSCLTFLFPLPDPQRKRELDDG